MEGSGKMTASDFTAADPAAQARSMHRFLASPIFSLLPPANIQTISKCLEPRHFRAGQLVVRQGSLGTDFFVIQRGECLVHRQAAVGSRWVTLARLAPGDVFGEESLIVGAPRNASVIMHTDGVLGRLSAQDFETLIGAPILRELSVEAAQAAVARGAIWLDVRFPEEHHRGAPAGAVNVPLNTLRGRASSLDARRHYVCCSGDGRRARVAAFLLAMRGIRAAYLSAPLERVLGLPPVDDGLPEIDLSPSAIADSAAPPVSPAVLARRAELAREQLAIAAARAAATARLEQMREVEYQRDLQRWREEEARGESSPERRRALALQRARMARIRAEADAARSAAREHDQRLLEELAAQLRAKD